MASCGSIKILEQIDHIPQYLKDSQGYVKLDLQEGFSFQENKVLNELTNLNEFQSNYITGISIADTGVNRMLANTFIHPNAEEKGKQLDALLESGCGSSIEKIKFRRKKKGRIDVDLIQGTDNWANKLSNVPFKDVFKDEEITFGCDSAIDNIMNNFEYTPGNDFWWFPEAFYGNSHSSRGYGQAREEDEIDPFACGDNTGSITLTQQPITYQPYNICKALTQQRPWLYVTDVMKKIFCCIGADFYSPLLDSKFGRRLLTYDLRKDFGTGDEKNQLNMFARKKENSFIVGFTEPGGHTECAAFDEVLYDNGSNYTGNTYCGVGTVKIKGKVTLRMLDDSGDGDSIAITLMKRGKGQNVRGSIYQQTQYTSWEDDQIICFEFDEEISLSEKQEICIQLWRSNEDTDMIMIGGDNESFIEVIGCRKLWEDGDTFLWRDLVDCDIKALEYVKGITRALNLKWWQDPSNCKIIALQPYEVEILEEKIPGFFDELEPVDWYDRTGDKGSNVGSEDINSPRFCEIKYKDASDPFIKNNDDIDGDPWSTTIDLGSQFVNQATKTIDNKLFESTASIFQSMAFTDPDQEDEWCIGHKLVQSFGLRETLEFTLDSFAQQFFDVNAFTSEYLDCNHEIQTLFPIAGQVITTDMSDEGGGPIKPWDQIAGNGSLAYSANQTTPHDPLNTGYNLFYAQYLLEGSLIDGDVEDLVMMNCKEFTEINFRNRYIINVCGESVITRLKEVRDFQSCKNITTPVVFTPIKTIEEICNEIGAGGEVGPGGGNQNPICVNRPLMICEKVGDCWVLSIGGDNQAVITSVLWQWREIGGSWNAFGLGGTAQICDEDFIDECIEIRATVSYGEIEVDGVTVQCPPVNVPIKKIYKCISVIPVLNCEIVEGDGSGCATASIEAGGELYDSFLLVDIGDGEGFKQYAEGDVICGITGDVVFTGSVDFLDDECDPVTVGPVTCTIPQEITCPTELMEIGEPQCDDENKWTIPIISIPEPPFGECWIGDFKIQYQCKENDQWDIQWSDYQTGNKPQCMEIRFRTAWCTRSKCCKDVFSEILHECKSPNAGEDTTTIIT